MQEATIDSPGVIAFPPLLALATLAIGIGAHCIHPVPIHPPVVSRMAGALSASVAVCLIFTARNEMAKAGTNVNPSLPATAIVTGGPFRFTRNPMYLSLCL
jgi:protein-S-isoprenylcysteine O-methyltransferase Ste14